MDYDAIAVSSEVLSPREFLKREDELRRQAQHIEIIPPKLGTRSLGGVRVTYKSPLHRVASGRVVFKAATVKARKLGKVGKARAVVGHKAYKLPKR